MSWLGLLLVGLGLTDVVFSLTRRPRVAEGAAAAGVVVLGLLAGLTSPLGIASLLVVAALVVGWGESVTYGFGSRRAWVPLVMLGVALAAGVLASGAAPQAGGVLGDLLRGSDLGGLADLDPDRALLVAGALLVQLATGNVLVRLVLLASHTTNPMRTGQSSPGHAASALKGGRLLGPMERVFIVGLGLAGEVTAASIVIAAKGLLRFPELQAAQGTPSGGGPGIHEVTEYFLVGSFVSWSISLATVALLAA